jgi:hypothetical protein
MAQTQRGSERQSYLSHQLKDVRLMADDIPACGFNAIRIMHLEDAAAVPGQHLHK